MLTLVTMEHLPPLLLPEKALYNNAANIGVSLIFIEFIHQIFRRRASMVSKSNSCEEQRQQEHYKTAVQLTHLAVNFTLAAIGTYCWYGPVRPPRWNDCSLVDRWTGFQHYSFFGNIMISYNVWSSYASWAIWGHEDLIMTCHHIMACIIGFLSSFTNYGWNYYAPFFFGFIEISSVPLSLLNAFNIRQDWVKEMPLLHLVTKILFAVTFIGARVFSWNANMHLFFKDTWRLVTASSSDVTVSMTARVIIFLAGDVPAVFLTVLQLFWASKIVEAVLLMISSGKNSKKQS